LWPFVYSSGLFQNFSTIVKVLFILFLLGLGVYFAEIPNSALQFESPVAPEVFKSGFAVSLLYVTYAYTGWNTSAYIVGEIKSPKQNLPKSLIMGTLFVTVVYVLLQLVILKFASTAQLWISAGIAFQLIATMSSYIWVGPRIIHAMAQHFSHWKWLRPSNAQNIPIRAIWFQGAIILLLLFSGSLEQILLYTSFLLQLMGTLAVASIFFIKSQSDSFRSPLKPYLQYLYVGFSVFVLIFIVIDRPTESLMGLGILFVGAVTYFFGKRDNF